MAYRSTPHTVTEETPSQRFLGRTISTKLDLMKPKLNVQKVNVVKLQQRKLRVLKPGDKVVSKTFNSKDKWISGIIVQKVGSKLFKVRINGVMVIRHIDQIKRSFTPSKSDSAEDAWDYTIPITSGSDTANENELPPRRYPVRERHPICRYGYNSR